jgi:hypothetical protein
MDTEIYKAVSHLKFEKSSNFNRGKEMTFLLLHESDNSYIKF